MLWRAAIALLALGSVAHAQDVRFGPLGPTATAPTGQIPAVTDGSAPLPGTIGEIVQLGVTGASLAATLTSGSPTVVTMSGNTLAAGCQISTGSANQCIQPIYFTGLVGTNGVANNTAYFVDPNSISGSTFKIATTVANAIAGTDVNTTGTDSGTGRNAAYLTTSGTGQALAAINLTAGDWDCTGQLAFAPVAANAPTSMAVVVANGAGTLNLNNSSAAQIQTTFVTGVSIQALTAGFVQRTQSARAPIYLNGQMTWTGGASNPTVTHNMLCRRAR